MSRVLRYTIQAKDEFSDTFNRLINISDTATGFIVGSLGIRAADAISSMTSDAVDNFKGVEVSLKRVAAATGAFGDAADRLITKLETEIQVGQELGFTMSQTAEILERLTMAGYSVEESMGVIEPVMRLATIETMEMSEAVQLTVSILGMFGLAADEAARVTDVLANAAVEGILPISKIGMGLAYVGKQAAAMGSGLEETTAALVIATNQGLRAHMAGRYLRRTFQDLVENEEKLGFAIRDARGEMLSLTELIQKLDNHLNSLNSTYERTNYVNEIFGIQARTMVYALTNVGDSAEDVVLKLKELTEEFKMSGTSVTMAEEILDTFDGAMKKLDSSISKISYEFGGNLTPIIMASIPLVETLTHVFATALVPVLKMVTNSIKFFTPALQTMGAIFVAVGPGVIALLTKYIALKIGISAIIPVIRRLAEVQTVLKIAMSFGREAIIQQAIAIKSMLTWLSRWNMGITHGTLQALNLNKTLLIMSAGFKHTSLSVRQFQKMLVTNEALFRASISVGRVYNRVLTAMSPILDALSVSLGISASMATLLATALGGMVAVAGIYFLIYAVKHLGDSWKKVMDRMETATRGATITIITDIAKLKDEMDSARDSMVDVSSTLTTLTYIFEVNRIKMEALRKEYEAGAISAAEYEMAIIALQSANKQLAPLLERGRLDLQYLTDQQDMYNTKLTQEEEILKRLADVRQRLINLVMAGVTSGASKKDLKELQQDLEDLGIEVEKTGKLFGIFKRDTMDAGKALKALDSVIDKSGDIIASYEDIIASLSDEMTNLSDDFSMTQNDMDSFWRSVESMAIMRGRGMLGVLSDIVSELDKLQYVTGATNREIQRLDLRYRENELMIREIEKSMSEGTLSYAEGAAMIAELRKENEKLSLARDEARLEQDKINLAMEEAYSIVEAYQMSINNLVKAKGPLIARLEELMQIQEENGFLTREQQDEYSDLQTEIGKIDDKISDYADRLDDLKDKFPALETAQFNLLDAIREFAEGVNTGMIGPLEDAGLLIDGFPDGLDFAFSTEFDFDPQEMIWDPIMSTIQSLQDEEWTITFRAILDASGLGDFDIFDDGDDDDDDDEGYIPPQEDDLFDLPDPWEDGIPPTGIDPTPELPFQIVDIDPDVFIDFLDGLDDIVEDVGAIVEDIEIENIDIFYDPTIDWGGTDPLGVITDIAEDIGNNNNAVINEIAAVVQDLVGGGTSTVVIETVIINNDMDAEELGNQIAQIIDDGQQTE